MALRFPARTKATTSNTGSLSTFTIAEPATAGWRTFTKATTDGDLGNGDTVGLIIVDTTVSNGVNLLQVVTAIWNNTTKQFSITQNHQPSVPPSWGAGTRDVVCIDNPALFLLLAGGTMTGLLNILLSGAIINPAVETGLVVQRSGGSSDSGVSVVSAAAGKSKMNLGDVDDEDAGGWYYNNATNELISRTNGADRIKVDSSGVLVNSTGTQKFVSLAGGNTNATLWYQAAAPTGWARITSVTEHLVCLVSAGSPGTAAAGAGWVPTVTTDPVALTMAQIGATTAPVVSMGSINAFVSSGGATDHNHTVNVDSAYRPPRAFVLAASFN